MKDYILRIITQIRPTRLASTSGSFKTYIHTMILQRGVINPFVFQMLKTLNKGISESITNGYIDVDELCKYGADKIIKDAVIDNNNSMRYRSNDYIERGANDKYYLECHHALLKLSNEVDFIINNSN